MKPLWGLALFIVILHLGVHTSEAGIPLTEEEAREKVTPKSPAEESVFSPADIETVLEQAEIGDGSFDPDLLRRAVASRLVPPPTAKITEEEKLESLAKRFAGPGRKLFVEINLVRDQDRRIGSYISVFWKQPTGKFKHVFSDYVSGARDGFYTPNGEKHVETCSKGALSGSYDSAIMDYYLRLYTYTNGHAGGLHVTSQPDTVGGDRSHGCLNQRLETAYKIYHLYQLVLKTDPNPKTNSTFEIIGRKPDRFSSKKSDLTFYPKEIPHYLYYSMESAQKEDPKNPPIPLELEFYRSHGFLDGVLEETAMMDKLQLQIRQQGPDEKIIKTPEAEKLSRKMHDEEERHKIYCSYLQDKNVVPYTLEELDGPSPNRLR